MISSKPEVEADSDNFTASETMSTTTESSFENQGGRNRGRTEAERKMKKLRSIKLSRMPSRRKGRSSSSSQFHTMLSGDAASSEQSTPIETSDASPNHINSTSSSDAKEKNFQIRTLTRKSSMKFRRPQRKSSGGTDSKKKLNSSPDMKKGHLQASPHHSESFDNSDQDKKISTNETQKSAYPGNKSIRVVRTSTLGPMKILTKMASLKSKRPSMKKCSEISSISDPSVERATCSSTLKDSKFPDQVEIKQGGSESDGTSVLNVCRYSYCSLHGHHRSDKPPLKRFVSMRRRVAKTQKSSKPDRQSSGNRKKGTQTEKRVSNGVLGIEVQQTTVDSREISQVPRKEDFVNLAESVRSEEKNEDSELDHGILQAADSTVASATDVECKTEMENQKNFTFWKLIYKHMVTGLDTECETQKPLPGVNSEEQVENLHDAHEKNDSCQEFSRTDQAMNIEDHEASDRKLEFTQSDAIKLVQQAFDKILSEIPDHSSDDQSIASEITSGQDFPLKQDEGKEVSISTSSNSIEDRIVQDREEKQLQTDNKIASEEVKAAQMEGKKSDKQMPSSWSNLKKIIILNRFVKSLEKLRNRKPRTTRYLPKHEDPEAEKIHLRHQNMKGRKNAEEWMLDHALRQVISTLAPSQKRKVDMLVQAFETVIPQPENGNDLRSHAAASSLTTSVQAYIESSVHNADGTEKENNSEISPGKAFYSEMSSKDDEDPGNESHTAHQQIPKASPEPKEKSLLCGSTEQPLCVADSEMSSTDVKKEDTRAVDGNIGNRVSIFMDVQPKLVDLSLSELEEPRLSYKSLNHEDAERTCHEKFPVNEEVTQTISRGEIPILDSEVSNGGVEFKIKKIDCSDLMNSADQHPGKPESPTEVGEGAQIKYKSLSPPLEQSESNYAADVSKSERQKYTRLWYLIYKHMVSGSATQNGSQPLHDGADEEAQGDHSSKFPGENNADCQGSFGAGQDMMENYRTGSRTIKCHNNEIVKLVEEAIDQIPLPEVQDDTSDNQSVTGDSILDQELPEKKHGEEEVKFISSSTASAKEKSEEATNITAKLHSTLNSEEKILKSEEVSTQKEAERGSEEGTKSKKRVQGNWSNLKKLILLRRFVKALEKVREFNPRGPHYLPLDPAPESEKVHLRHQNMEDRKNAEEWMLDHALQQVVAKLTPERKRRVELLVEAFETVIPTTS